MLNINQEDLKNLNLYCFDLEQYNKNAKYLGCTVFVNWEGVLYHANVKVWLSTYCEWRTYKWILSKNLLEIKNAGLTKIITHLYEQGEFKV